MKRNGALLAALATTVAAVSFFAVGGCTTSSNNDKSTKTLTTTLAANATNTPVNSSTPAPTATPTIVPCTGSVVCNPTATGGGSTQTPYPAAATLSVSWSASGCSEVHWYGYTPDGFNFSTGTGVVSNATNDDGHIHLSTTYAGVGYWHDQNAGVGMIDMGAIPLSDPLMANPLDPSTNVYLACCVQALPDHSYFIKCTTGWARVHIECVDITAGAALGIRYQWDWGS